MTERPASRNGIRMAAVTVLLFALAACATPFRADVSRYSAQLPAPSGQSFAVVADDPEMAGGLEFAQYASLVAENMNRLGYAQADPENATLLVRFDYGVDRGRERITSSAFGAPGYWSPWYGGYYGRFGARSRFYGGPWAFGWHDPFFDSSVQSYTVYTSGIDMKIDRRADGERLFEGSAQAVSTSNRLQYLVPNLVDAMFTDFPGNSGETVRITVAPEKK